MQFRGSLKLMSRLKLKYELTAIHKTANLFSDPNPLELDPLVAVDGTCPIWHCYFAGSDLKMTVRPVALISYTKSVCTICG